MARTRPFGSVWSRRPPTTATVVRCHSRKTLVACQIIARIEQKYVRLPPSGSSAATLELAQLPGWQADSWKKLQRLIKYVIIIAMCTFPSISVHLPQPFRHANARTSSGRSSKVPFGRDGTCTKFLLSRETHRKVGGITFKMQSDVAST